MRVLIVDDDRDIQMVMEMVLEDAGCEVILANDGLEAWELLQKGEKFDMILSDNSMPRMTGLELLENMRACQRTAEMPFVLMSGGTGLSEICKRLGILFLEKPFDYGAIRSLVYCSHCKGSD